MINQHTPSRPFPNGMTFMFFNESFCCRCDKYKLDDDGMPLPDNCKVEEVISQAQFDESKWPADDIVEVGDMDHICLRFKSDGAYTMRRYRELFEGERG